MAGTLSAKRIAATAVLLAILCGAAWVAGKRFLADVSKADAGYFIDRWRAGKVVLDPVRLDELHAQLNRAVALDPGNALIEFELATLQLSRLGRWNLVDPVVRARLAEARDRYARAAMLRPTWERAWANLALCRYALGQIDGEFFAAMELSLRHGPWNQQTQMSTIRIGLAAWPLLPTELQSRLRLAIHRQAHWRLAPQATTLRAVMTSLRRTELLCLLEAAPKGCTP